MLRIGLTGGIGAGKSIVSKILTALNYPVFNSDNEAKKLLVNDSSVIAEMKAAFGDDVYHSDGTINRAYLADVIFKDSNAREQINAIVHPRVRIAFDEFVTAQNAPLIFNEAAILFETGAYKNFDATILVAAPDHLRIERVMKRDNVSREQVVARMNAQWSDDKKKDLADVVIMNDEHVPLIPQVEAMLATFIQPQ